MNDIERYHVACTSISGQLCIGRVNKAGDAFLDKRYATDEILLAVVMHLSGVPMRRAIIGIDGKTYELSLKQRRTKS